MHYPAFGGRDITVSRTPYLRPTLPSVQAPDIGTPRKRPDTALHPTAARTHGTDISTVSTCDACWLVGVVAGFVGVVGCECSLWVGVGVVVLHMCWVGWGVGDVF
ncbi:hypothetical protein [Mycobacterium riyadhense]|uniref:hypothetical protein n=1 Tax=Mycobacterium riyadhense TaxID=486698 RepID=UPI00195E26FD|nr:hypothetical protein [Mycobacterium riyadhense]